MTNTTLFLIITGTVIVAGCLVFKLLIKLYRKPILEINLSPLDHPRWSDTHKITDLIDSFLRNGFEPAGGIWVDVYVQSPLISLVGGPLAALVRLSDCEICRWCF